ncbi:Phosphate transport system regulatory protein PhoU [Actinomycetales bacterium JB111]|nr:Phosphate transport system regulatory protein PhoU [Actinomycetales bacterium JB111]
MRKIFTHDLEQLQDNLIRLAEASRQAMTKAAEALRSANLVLAEQVIDADDRIDELDRQLNEQGVALLALQAPVSRDLRQVISALRLSSTLERMGDLAQHVAMVARGRFPDHVVGGSAHDLLIEMADEAVRVADDVVDLVVNVDLETARRIEEKDHILDALHLKTFDLVLDDSIELTRQEIVDVILLGRYLERFGDHGVSAAHRINYLVTGDPVREADED